MKISLLVSLIFVCGAFVQGNEDTTTSVPSQDDIPQTVTLEAEKDPNEFICECAIIDTQNPAKTNNIVLKQKTINISCDVQGEDKCIKLCTALAKASKDHGPQIICNSLGHVDKLKVSLYSRVCGSNKWTYTGITAPKDLCCHDHQEVDCKPVSVSSP